MPKKFLFALPFVCLVLLAAATGNLRWTQLRQGDRHGAGIYGQASDGTGAAGHFAAFDSTGNLTDGGTGTGGGTANWGAIGGTLSSQTDLNTALGAKEDSALLESGASLYCASSSNSATAYTCALNPGLTGYTAGMVIHWRPDVNCGAGASLNVNGLGAKSLTLADGTTAASCTAGQLYILWFDGTVIRIGFGNYFTLSWTGSASPGVVGYNVYRGTVSGGPYTLLASVGAVTSYNDTTAHVFPSYYVVTARDGAGAESSYSTETSATL